LKQFQNLLVIFNDQYSLIHDWTPDQNIPQLDISFIGLNTPLPT